MGPVAASFGSGGCGLQATMGFGTFGGPDVAAITAVAGPAMNNIWYRSGISTLLTVPSRAAPLRQILTGNGHTIDATLNQTVLNSRAMQSSFSIYDDYFLSQAFPEGSRTHPAYPTGHGTVAGACITVFEVLLRRRFSNPDPLVPSSDGLSLFPSWQTMLLRSRDSFRHPLTRRHRLVHKNGRGLWQSVPSRTER